MPSGAKKRKAAKKKQEQASSTLINLESDNHDSRSQDESKGDDGVGSQENYKKSGFSEEDSIRIEKEPGLATDERVEITDSSHVHDKSSSSSSSDEEPREVRRKNDNTETGDFDSQVTTVSNVPNQLVPIAGDTTFIGSTANVIVENTGLMDSTKSTDPNSEEVIEITNETDEKPLPKPTEITAEEVSLATDEIRQASSGATGSYVEERVGKTSPLTESSGVPEGSRESEVVVSQEEETLVRPTHGIAQRTSWFSCCGLFDVVTGSSRQT